MDEALKVALVQYSQVLGLKVFPVHTVIDGECTCNSHCSVRNAGKHPRIANWQKEASSNLAKVMGMFHKWPQSNIGVVTGSANGIFVVDIDKYEAWDSLDQEMPTTHTYKTAGGGRHLWFKYPDFLITNSSGSLPRGIDIRGTGGYVLVPPSVTHKGTYQAEQVVPLTPVEAPEWLLEALHVPEDVRTNLVEERGLKSFGDLDNETKSRYERYIKGCIDSEIEALKELTTEYGGQWNQTTFNTACNLFELAKAPWSPFLSSGAESIIRENVPDFDDEGWNQEVLDKLIDSAFKRVFHNTGVRDYPAKQERPTTPRTAKARSEAIEAEPVRPFNLVPISSIEIEKVEWLWDNRIALGEMGLLAGREGIGKSLISVWLSAQLSMGLLPGEFLGQPKKVLYMATEDSWKKTLAPRFKVSGADMDLIFKEELEEQEGIYLPRDTARFAETIKKYGISLIVMDPLMSYVGAKANTYSGREVRAALEPIVKICHEFNVALLGLIHFNKTASDDILNRITDSKAFTQLTRTVTVVERDEEQDAKNYGLIDTVKNNLGRMDMPAISYRIVSVPLTTPKGELTDAPQLEILGNSDAKVEDIMRENGSDMYRGQTKDAAEWLTEYIEENQGAVWAKDALKEGVKHDFKEQTLRRALKRTRCKSQRMGGSDVGFAWFKESFSRDEAREILDRKSNAIFQKERVNLKKDLDF